MRRVGFPPIADVQRARAKRVMIRYDTRAEARNAQETIALCLRHLVKVIVSLQMPGNYHRSR